MQTEKLYELDSYVREMDAPVLACEPYKDGWASLLSATAFYPEGGGQPADHGLLGDVPVTHVFTKNEVEVWHVTPRPLPVGQQVHGVINWARRFDFMQQHSGEHLATGQALRLFGANNAGFHLSENTVLLDLDKELEDWQLLAVEAAANRAVWANAPAREWFPASEELEDMTFRAKPARIHGQLRIVDLGGFDTCACCGTHVARTGEVGAVKFLSAQRHKGGTRIVMASGARALADYRQKQNEVQASMALLSAKADGVAQAVTALLAENERLRGRLSTYKAKAVAEAAQRAAVTPAGAFWYDKGFGPDDVRRLAVALAERTPGLCLALGGEDGALRYALASTGTDVRPVAKQLNAALSGRGGGSAELAQGSAACTREQALQAARAMGLPV